jgi:hypothetical protein
VSGHARSRAGWFAAALAAAACAAPAGTLPAALAFPALAVTLAIAPGALLARRLAPGWPADTRWSLVLVGSPFAAGGAITLLRLSGLDTAGAMRAVAIAVLALAVFHALRRQPEPGPRAPHGWPARLALGFGLAVLALHAFVPELSLRSDGAFHAGVVRAIERELPPEDPFFAGLRLRYFWGLHAWAAAWVAARPAIPATAPLVLANASAAIAALLAVGSLARRLGASGRAALLAQGLALAGAAPFAWLVLAARAASGEVRGADEWGQALGHGVDPALRALDPGWLHPSLVLSLDKFVVLTPFAWPLAGVALAASALAAAWDERTARAAAPLALVVAAVVFAHPLGGLAVAGSLLAALVTLGVAAPAGRRTAAIAAVFVVGAVALLVPHLVQVAGGGAGAGSPVRFEPRLAGFASALVAGAWLVPPALAWLLGRDGREPFRLALAAMLGALVLPACLLQLGGDNQSKFLGLAFLLAAAPAAMAWPSRGRARALVAGLFLASSLPTVALVGWACVRQSSASADAPSRPPAGIVAAVRERSPRDAVLVDATLDPARGAAPGLPGATGRSLIWGGGFMAGKWGYAPRALAVREAAATSLARGEWPAGEAGELLAKLGREAWVVLHEDSARVEEPRAHVVARAGGVLLVRMRR